MPTPHSRSPRLAAHDAASPRMRDMDTLLRWEGELTNSRVREVFGVQAVQASRLLSAYIAERGAALSRLSPRAPVTPAARFDALVAPPSSPDDYFRLLEGAQGSALGVGLLVDARPKLSGEDAWLFSNLLKACRFSTGLRIVYASMNHPNGLERTIYPHSLVRAPRRWHARAWCDLRRDFRDFALGRIFEATPLPDPSPKVRRQDADWNKLVPLKIVAHPSFDGERQQLMRREYFAGRASTVLRVRKALAGYVIQDLRLATDLERDRPPQFQLYLENSQTLGGEFPSSRP